MPLSTIENEQFIFDLDEAMSNTTLTPTSSATKARAAVLDSLHGENSYLSQQLNSLQHCVDAWQPRQPPNYTLLYNTMRQLHDYPHDVLQPKEDLVYRQLMRRDADEAEVFASIRQQHEHIQALSKQLLKQLSDVSHGVKPARRDRLRPRLQQFIDAFRRHIDAEENEILPTAEKQLLDSDWYALQTGIGYLESGNTNHEANVKEAAFQPSAERAMVIHQPAAQTPTNGSVASFSLLPLIGAYSLAETIGNVSVCARQLTELSVKQTKAGLNASLDEIMACRDTSSGVADLPRNLMNVTLRNMSDTWRDAGKIVKKNWQRYPTKQSSVKLLQDA